jgi:Mrp family chromosome partitioning ATPase
MPVALPGPEGRDEPSEPAEPAVPGSRPGGLPILTAIVEPALEATIVAALARRRLGVTVVRRCVDLPDLLAAAGTATATAAVVSAGMRRFDQDAITRLRAAGVAVVALVAPASEAAGIRLRQMGVEHVVSGAGSVPSGGTAEQDALAAAVADAVRASVHALSTGGGPSAGEPERHPGPRAAHSTAYSTAHSTAHLGAGSSSVPPRVVAVWGPTGAPGRSFLAWQLAGEAAAAGIPTLVVDADVYGGSIAPLAGLVDEAPGIVAACRAANAGALDVARLATLARRVPVPTRDGAALAVLTGIPRAARWPEIRPASLETVLRRARSLADLVVVDCGFNLEDDEELSYDTAAPRRNAATLAALGAADEVLVIGSAEPVGLTRLIAGLPDLRETLAAAGVAPEVRVVVNRLRATSRARREVIDALARHAGVDPVALLPLDLDGADRAEAGGRLLLECAPRSPVRPALATLLPGRAPATVDEPARRRWRAPANTRSG